jgi:hypothetical protein
MSANPKETSLNPKSLAKLFAISFIIWVYYVLTGDSIFFGVDFLGLATKNSGILLVVSILGLLEYWWKKGRFSK